MPREIVNTESFGRIADRMHFAQGVRANGFLFCSGVIGFDRATGRRTSRPRTSSAAPSRASGNCSGQRVSVSTRSSR